MPLFANLLPGYELHSLFLSSLPLSPLLILYCAEVGTAAPQKSLRAALQQAKQVGMGVEERRRMKWALGAHGFTRKKIEEVVLCSNSSDEAEQWKKRVGDKRGEEEEVGQMDFGALRILRLKRELPRLESLFALLRRFPTSEIFLKVELRRR